MTQQPPVEETVPLDYETEPEEDWLHDEPDEAPPRPRRKLFSPVPVTLLVILLTACGFLAGIEVEKGQTSSGSGGGLAAGLAALRSRVGAGKTSSGGATGSSGGFRGAGGFPGASGGGFPAGGGGFAGAGAIAGGVTTGEVSFANGNTLYVTSGEGNTVKVSAPQGTAVSKTVTTSVHSIHPGDTVIVRGSQNKNGSVSASSISVSSSGGSTSGAGSSNTGGIATQQLFGAG